MLQFRCAPVPVLAALGHRPSRAQALLRWHLLMEEAAVRHKLQENMRKQAGIETPAHAVKTVFQFLSDIRALVQPFTLTQSHHVRDWHLSPKSHSRHSSILKTPQDCCI